MMEKLSVSTEKQRSSHWINLLTFLTVVQTVTFIGVTVFTFVDVFDLDEKEAILRWEIQRLESQIQEYYGSSNSKHGREIRASTEQPADVRERIKRHLKSRLVKRQSSLFVDMLKIQERILEKHCQDRNKTCPSGPKGEKGSRGQQGVDGLRGQPGFDGQRGSQGQNGQPGAKGPSGSTGIKGEPGTTGAAGPIGKNGTKGEDGLKGLKGEPGPKGLKGNPGLAGEIGQPGITGDQGINQTQGQKGDMGDTGIKGALGDTGVQGPKGNDSRKFADDCDCFTKPSFFTPSDSTVFVSLTFSQDLPCNATGNPQPTISVQKVTTGKRNVVSNGSKVSIFNTSNLDYGSYVCEARNQFGTVKKYITIGQPTG